jgi:NAD(P)-dependent dehydrogenase (short-subunit alcohol dehydrogenase family)
LTGLLLPAMSNRAGSRVVAVSSIAARSGRIDFDDPMGERNYDAWKAYNQSKLANLIFACELDRRLQAARLATRALAAHPGAATTNLSTPAATCQARRLAADDAVPVPFGAAARPILFAATAVTPLPEAIIHPVSEMKGPPRQPRC